MVRKSSREKDEQKASLAIIVLEKAGIGGQNVLQGLQ